MTANKTEQRNARLESQIRSVLADLLRFQVKDPRLEGVTVSGVRLSAERSHARVFFSLYGDAERERHARDGFAAAGAFLRRELGRLVRMRITPELEFVRDASFEYGDRIERIFTRLQTEGLLPAADTPGEEPEP
jgi:ribosome-binding factor A